MIVSQGKADRQQGEGARLIFRRPDRRSGVATAAGSSGAFRRRRDRARARSVGGGARRAGSRPDRSPRHRLLPGSLSTRAMAPSRVKSETIATGSAWMVQSARTGSDEDIAAFERIDPEIDQPQLQRPSARPVGEGGQASSVARRTGTMLSLSVISRTRAKSSARLRAPGRPGPSVERTGMPTVTPLSRPAET